MDSTNIIALARNLATSLTLEDKIPSEEILSNIAHYFRELRSLCAKGKIYQDIVAESNIVQHAIDILYKLSDDCDIHSEQTLVCIRVGVQFVGNFIVDNTQNKNYIWQNHKSILRGLLTLNDYKARNYSAMVTYNIVKDNQNNIEIAELQEFFPAIIDTAVKESEFGLFCLEHLLTWPDLLTLVYSNLGLSDRLFVLEVSRRMLSRGEHLPADMFTLLALEFKHRADSILMSSKSIAEPAECVALLETIATASGFGDCEGAQKLKQDMSLLTSAVFLLRIIHESFEIKDKLAAFSSFDLSMTEFKSNPLYGFKAQLVRLIGNLCWQHQGNQDKTRELEGIQLLLNCSRLDACNPFITQWVVLAIRNVCEHNVENQAVIASLQQEGDAPLMNSVLRLRPDDRDASKMNVS